MIEQTSLWCSFFWLTSRLTAHVFCCRIAKPFSGKPFPLQKKIKKRKKKNIPRRYEVYKSAARLFSCRTKRKRAIPWGHDMTWHTHTARSCRQLEDRITVITITLRTKWYGCHIVLGVFMVTFSTLNIVQRFKWDKQ